MFTRVGGGSFLGFPVRPSAELPDESPEAIVLASFERPEPLLAELTSLGLPADKILTLRRPAVPLKASGAGA